jgi:hypothetical protein
VPTGLRERADLEDMADKWLLADREQTRTKNPGGQHLVHGILSSGQWELREWREVLMKTGELGSIIQNGLYRRVWAGFDHRPTSRRRYSLRQDPWRQDLYDSGSGPGAAGNWIPSALREEVTSGQHYLSITPRDPAWPVDPRQGYYHHLDRLQRSRIRAMMCKVSGHARAREVVMFVLAQKYGVPPWVITRCVVKGKR